MKHQRIHKVAKTAAELAFALFEHNGEIKMPKRVADELNAKYAELRDALIEYEKERLHG